MKRLNLKIVEKAPLAYSGGILDWNLTCMICGSDIQKDSPMLILSDGLNVCRDCARQIHYQFSIRPEIDKL